ncbi:MAG: DNA/RNA nuclease SfsA [Magnetococcales bacterium]|nr:DNA/RNA nuclease SfsA [Magnetococcales bacterium]
MDFCAPLVPALLLRRYNRFLADFQMENGSTVTAHCANTGSMMGLLTPGSEAMLSHSDNPQRKLAYTWELVRENDSWVGLHTGRTNAIVLEALKSRILPEFNGYGEFKPEVRLDERGRLDFCLGGDDLPPCFVEVKSVTLRQGNAAMFPDAVTKRGLRHLEALASLKQQGFRSVLLFVVQREDCHLFRPASTIDPAYAATLRQVVQAGVEVLVYCCAVGPQAITLSHAVPWALD